MDSVTQFVLGAAVQGVGMGKYQKRKALIYGGLLGTLPDLDVFISHGDPISDMTFHRGFSHSIFTLTLLALIIAILIFKLRKTKPEYSFIRLFLTITLALITHPFIDAMTVYGTQYFWPFHFTPLSWSTVFVIDPVYTVPLIVTCIMAWFMHMSKKARRWLLAALLFGLAYYGWGFYSRFHHENRVITTLERQGIIVDKVLASPTPFNTILWRVIATDNKGNGYEALSGWFDKKSPEWQKYKLNLNLYNQIQPKSKQLKRLAWFTNNWLAYKKVNNKIVVADRRMGFNNHSMFEFVVAKKKQGNYYSPIKPVRYKKDKLNVNATLLKKLGQRMLGNQNVSLLPDANHTEKQ